MFESLSLAPELSLSAGLEFAVCPMANLSNATCLKEFGYSRHNSWGKWTSVPELKKPSTRFRSSFLGLFPESLGSYSQPPSFSMDAFALIQQTYSEFLE